MPNKRNILSILGPGLLFAGAAVGVSHLVQATKAGATYGFELVWAVCLALLFKYPFFEFGTRYAMSTGETLIEGYKKQGNWVLGLFILMTVGTMFTIQAAVTVVTAGLAIHLFGITSSLLLWCAIILGLCTGILLLGRYKILDNLMKVIIITLTISTLIALLSVLIWGSPVTNAAQQQHFAWDVVGIGFLLALMGWMPAPLDLAVWSSIWSLEKKKLQPDNTLETALLDFNVGYIGTAFLAFSFLALGALVMYGSGEVLSPKGAVFASQLINLYASTLGDWATPVIAIAAFTTMFSTTLTCLDAFPRVMRQVTTNILPKYKDTQHKNLYWIWMLITIAGTFLLLSNISSMGQMISIATILSFLTAPVLAFINYKLVTSTQVPTKHQPPKWLLYLSWAGFVFLIGFCGLYLSSFF